MKKRNRPTKNQVKERRVSIGKVSSKIKEELDSIRTIIIDSAAFEVLLKDPFPLPSEAEGIKHAVILKVIEEKEIQGDPNHNIAYILEQKAVRLFLL